MQSFSETPSNNLHRVSQEWARRPDDQRYTSLADLKAAVARRKGECWTATPPTSEMRVLPSDEGLSCGYPIGERLHPGVSVRIVAVDESSVDIEQEASHRPHPNTSIMPWQARNS
jgi:hypothetical protein